MQSQQAIGDDVVETTAPKCRNHPTIPSNYFVPDEPEVRYCKNCALNMALCGRRIEKELSQQQQARKAVVLAIVDQLRAAMAEVETNQAYFQQLSTLVDLNSPSILSRLQAIQQFIAYLSQLRCQLQAQYEAQLHARSMSFQLRVKQLSNDRQSIKLQLESIQSNFSSIIDGQQTADFEAIKAKWAETVSISTKDLYSQQQFAFERNKLGESLQVFEREFKEVSRLKVLEATSQLKDEENKENGQSEDSPNVPALKLVEELKLNLTANAHSKARQAARQRQSNKGPRTDRRREEVAATRRQNPF